MQLNFSLLPKVTVSVIGALSRQRLHPYMSLAERDDQLAIKFYIWNQRIAQAFYIPLQLFEVSFRNGITKGLRRTYNVPDKPWYKDGRFLSHLNPQMGRELDNALKKVLFSAKKEGEEVDIQGDIVAQLSLGFWESCLSKKLSQYIWENCITQDFSGIPKGVDSSCLKEKIYLIRKFRNRIFHHEPIWNKKPHNMRSTLIEVTGWINRDISFLINIYSAEISKAINERPHP
jgi:hypothetical protein